MKKFLKNKSILFGNFGFVLDGDVNGALYWSKKKMRFYGLTYKWITIGITVSK